MKNLSIGTGLALLAAAIVALPIVNRMSSLEQAAHALPPVEAAKAISLASTAQDPPTPTIVWYGVSNVGTGGEWVVVTRAWSDGKVELKRAYHGAGSLCTSSMGCATSWIVISSPAEGLTFDADLNFDQAVDGNDLGMLLAKWGPAPRNPVPPSDCPLALINP
jgi:hypothetical protein